jgi:hypothetical protein
VASQIHPNAPFHPQGLELVCRSQQRNKARSGEFLMV